MHKSFRLIAVSTAIAFSAGAFANDDPAMNSSSANSAVEALKASLKGESGFQVDKVVMSDDGAACIVYRVAGGTTGSVTRAQAVVEGDKVLRSSTRSPEFEKAWKDKCAGKKTAAN
jgi:hypothetical protein